MLPLLNEKQKRLFLASLANEQGYGSLKKICTISGYSPHTIIKGKKELQQNTNTNDQRIRKKGAGRKKLQTIHPNLLNLIEEIVSEKTYGNPQNPLIWTTKSLRNIQTTLQSKHKINISFKTIGTQLKQLGYSLQQNKKRSCPKADELAIFF